MALAGGSEPEPLDYPRMLYKANYISEETTVVSDSEQEAALIAQGWSRTPAARPPGFPKWFVEIDRSRGSNYRRVLLHNDAEEKTFHEVTEEANWIRDDGYRFGGYPFLWLLWSRRAKTN
jgi:hypothetical protein